MNPLVSVVIPTYNFAHSVSGAIDSALSQDYAPIEVIVADDGSTDDTLDVLQGYGDRIRVLALPHRGENATRNAAIRSGRGEYVAFLDHDDLWLPAKITTQVGAMEANPRAGLCHTAYLILDADRPPLNCTLDPPDRYHGPCFEALYRQNAIATLTVLARRSALPERLFHEDLKITADYAMWLSILFDHEALYIPEVLACYRLHPAQITHGRERRWKIFEGVSRLRLLDDVRDRIPASRRGELETWALDALEEASVERYRERDYAWARVGFEVLRRHGRGVPWRRRAVASGIHAWNVLVGRDARERRFLREPR